MNNYPKFDGYEFISWCRKPNSDGSGRAVFIASRVEDGLRYVFCLAETAGEPLAEAIALYANAPYVPTLVRTVMAESGAWEGSTWIVRDYVEGEPLPSSATPERMLLLLRGLLLLFHGLHREGFVQADFALNNFAVNALNEVWCFDMGNCAGWAVRSVATAGPGEGPLSPPRDKDIFFGMEVGDTYSACRWAVGCVLGCLPPHIRRAVDRERVEAQLTMLEPNVVRMLLDALDLRGRGLTAARALDALDAHEQQQAADLLDEGAIARHFVDDGWLGGSSRRVARLISEQSGGNPQVADAMIASLTKRKRALRLTCNGLIFVDSDIVEQLCLGEPLLIVHRARGELAPHARSVLEVARGKRSAGSVGMIAKATRLSLAEVNIALDDLERSRDACRLDGDRVGTPLADEYADDAKGSSGTRSGLPPPGPFRLWLTRPTAATRAGSRARMWVKDVLQLADRPSSVDSSSIAMFVLFLQATRVARALGMAEFEVEAAARAAEICLTRGQRPEVARCHSVLLGARRGPTRALAQLTEAALMILDGDQQAARKKLLDIPPLPSRLWQRRLMLAWLAEGTTPAREAWFHRHAKEILRGPPSDADSHDDTVDEVRDEKASCDTIGRPSPGMSFFSYLLGRTHYLQGRFSEAVASFREAIAGDLNPVLRLEIRTLLAAAFLDLRKCKEARQVAGEVLEEAIRMGRTRNAVRALMVDRYAAHLLREDPLPLNDFEELMEIAMHMSPRLAAMVALVHALIARTSAMPAEAQRYAARVLAVGDMEPVFRALAQALSWSDPSRSWQSVQIIPIVEASRDLPPDIALQVSGEAIRCFGRRPGFSEVASRSILVGQEAVCRLSSTADRMLELDSLNNYLAIFQTERTP